MDCLLRSLLRYWHYNDLQITVLYKHSNEEFREGYNRVFKRHWHVHPVGEYDFCTQIKHAVDTSLPTTVGFATDDCVFYRRPDISPDEIRDVLAYNNVHSLSLRLGENTVVQNYLNGEIQKSLISVREMYKDIIGWKWKLQPRYSNYGYGFSWDCHWYNRDFLLLAFQECTSWENPRALEHQMNFSDAVRGYSNGLMVTCKTSSVFINTVNAVQNQDIPSGTKYSYSPAELNKLWLSGKQIALRSFDNLAMFSCHEEVPLEFEDTVHE